MSEKERKHGHCHCHDDHCHDDHCHDDHCHDDHCHDNHCHESHDHEDSCGCHDGCACGHTHESASRWESVWRYVVLAFPLVLAFLPMLPTALRVVCAVGVYLAFGVEVITEMLRGFAKKRIFTEFTLMVAATVGAFALGEYADAAAVMYLYSLGETVSGSACRRSKRNIEALLSLTPQQVTVLRDGVAVSMPPEEVEQDALILINAGESVALDGVVTEGQAEADTSSVTGEALPKDLYEGVSCPSGSVLLSGSVVLCVTAPYQQSTAYQMQQAVAEASRRRSRLESRISRFASRFTPLAFAVAALVFAVGVCLTHEVRVWLRAALVLLVVSCPCSLVLSVPLTYFAGLGAATAKGMIFRGGEVMDAVAHMSCLVFDKTGTLTVGSLQYDGAVTCGAIPTAELEALAHDVLLHSPHAAAKAFCVSRTREVTHTVKQAQNIGGRGILAEVDGRPAVLGNAAFLCEQGIETVGGERTEIWCAYDGMLWGKLCFSAPVKSGAKEAVQSLVRSGVSRMAVVSGDVTASVACVAESVGISEYYGQQTPKEKLDKIDVIMDEERQKRRGAVIAFCGDGLNDSAAIAAADVGIAMGQSGSALTVQSADLVLMDDDLQKLVSAQQLSRRVGRIALSNIVLSLGIKLAVVIACVVIGGAFGMTVPMELAIIADVGAALLTVLNALRALKA